MFEVVHLEGCTGKQPYESRGVADKAGRAIGRRSKSKLWPYRCKHCQKWHLTSLDPRDHRRYREQREHADPCDLRATPSSVHDVSDRHLERRVSELEAQVARLTALTEGTAIMGLNLSQLIVDLNDNTNAVAARLDKLVADLAAAGNSAPTDAQLEELQAIAGHLKAMGTDPNAPIPAPPPVVTDATTAAANAAANAAASTPPADSTPAADTSSTPAAQGSTSSDPTPPAAADGSSSTPSA